MHRLDRQVLCSKIAPLDDKIAPPQNSSPGWQNSSPEKKSILGNGKIAPLTKIIIVDYAK